MIDSKLDSFKDIEVITDKNKNEIIGYVEQIKSLCDDFDFSNQLSTITNFYGQYYKFKEQDSSKSIKEIEEVLQSIKQLDNQKDSISKNLISFKNMNEYKAHLSYYENDLMNLENKIKFTNLTSTAKTELNLHVDDLTLNYKTPKVNEKESINNSPNNKNNILTYLFLIILGLSLVLAIVLFAFI